ncbi:acyltransferase family protein [Parablastomonas sp. CN1-191]|uniref:acyltransferase family protein n=1 Tax=Parablastomonas sp. CN1-191 TaxID=3400908 RepID=UPI003BF8E4B2
MSDAGARNWAGPYRPEVDGLRALAVVAVIFYHAGIPWIDGGYLGVDVFFVISGYLMTGIIVRQSQAPDFGLAAFFMRRIRRIVPALLVTVLASAAIAVPTLVPDALENFGESMVATALVANNVLLFMTGGYWDFTADLKPLMHTWSLAVEEQYYLLCVPLMLLAMRRWGRRGLAWGLAIFALASLLTAQAWTWGWLKTIYNDGSANAAYLLLPARVWELAAGGLAQTWRPGRQDPARGAAMLGWLGAAGMIAPMVLFGPAQISPGFHTALPIAAAVLYLVFAEAGSGAGRVFAWRPAVALGLISYSAYLVHQPLFAFARALSMAKPGPLQMLPLIPVTFALAWLCYRVVEQPLRDRRRFSDRRVLIASAAGSALCVAIGLGLFMVKGQLHPWPEMERPGFSYPAYVDGPFRFQDAALDPALRRRNVLVIGNSFARDFINMGLETGAMVEGGVRYAPISPCEAPLPAALAAQPADTAVIAFDYGPDEVACLLGWVRQLRSRGIGHVVILGSKDFGWSNSAVMRMPAPARYFVRVPVKSGKRESDAAAAAMLPPGLFLDTYAVLERGGPRGKVPVFTPDRKFISQDTFHLTPAGVRWLGPLIFAEPELRHLCAASSRCGPAPHPAYSGAPVG